MSPSEVQPPEPVLRLAEYSSASQAFLSDAIHAVARAEDGLLAQIRVEHVEALPPMQNTMPSGEVLRMGPAEASSVIVLTTAAGVAGDFEELHAAVASSAKDYAASVVPQMLAHISQICDATGNVVDAKGQSIWEAQLEMLETIEIHFDEDGNPSLPSLVLHPDAADKLGDPPDGFVERFNEILTRRRDEWLAQRRTRRLPRERQ